MDLMVSLAGDDDSSVSIRLEGLPYSPDILDDVSRRARELLHAAMAEGVSRAEALRDAGLVEVDNYEGDDDDGTFDAA